MTYEEELENQRNKKLKVAMPEPLPGMAIEEVRAAIREERRLTLITTGDDFLRHQTAERALRHRLSLLEGATAALEVA